MNKKSMLGAGLAVFGAATLTQAVATRRIGTQSPKAPLQLTPPWQAQ